MSRRAFVTAATTSRPSSVSEMTTARRSDGSSPRSIRPALTSRLHMRVAVDELELPPLYEAELWDYLVRAAHSMVNSE